MPPAAKSGPVVGTADMLLVPSAPGHCYVTNVCVAPVARRRGVARQMMDEICARMPHRPDRSSDGLGLGGCVASPL